MKKILILIAFSAAALFVEAQVFQRFDAPVIVDDTPLNSPWTGGINAPQWSSADLNEDGKPDLYAYDREGQINLTFINEGESGEINYRFAPEYAANFPHFFNSGLLRDYDNDGIMDLFAHAFDEGVPGLKVYDGYYEDGELKFDRLKMGHYPIDILTVKLNSGGYTNLNISNADLPDINDVDGDGDLDIVTLYFLTGRTFVYYKNMAIEQGFTADTMIFRTEELCWMGVYVPTLTTSLTLSCHPDSCGNTCPAAFDGNLVDDRSGGGVHGASTFLTHDFDGDGDVELLYGDLQYPQVNFLENDASSGTDWAVSQDTLYPSYDESALLPNFPASFKLDIDNDGVLEFLFSPNTTGATVRDRNNVFFYENTGTSEMPVLTKQSENLIERDMIDLGTTSQPTFFDHNADGLMDIVVGNLYEVTPSSVPNESYLHLYENTGTADAPAYTLVDEDYLGLSEFSSVSGAYAPAVGDLDNDGDLDMLVGDNEGKLFYVQNNGGAGNPVDWGTPQYNWKFIDVTQFATPHIFDANQDGKPDLLIGHKKGTVMYFENIGTPENPDFNPDVEIAPNNKKLGNISTQDQSTTAQGMTAPVVLALEDTTFIVTGSESGFLEVYVLDPEKLALDSSFYQISEKFANFYDGTYSRISFADLNDDEFLEMVIGNRRGGLSLFTSPFRDSGLNFNATKEDHPVLEFEIYPNPTDDQLNIKLPMDGLSQAKYRMFTSLGKTVSRGQINGSTGEISVTNHSPGLYFLEIKMGNKTGVKKVVVR